MTEKSEDVLHICGVCKESVWGVKSDRCPCCDSHTKLEHFAPLSKYLALQSDLAVAVEALEKISTNMELTGWDCIEITKEALGKIGGWK